jgi:hypothetical protein
MANEINRDNVIAKLLGEKDDNKLVLLPTSNTEAIGNFDLLQQKAQVIVDNSYDFNTVLQDMVVVAGNNNDNLHLDFMDDNNVDCELPFGTHGLDAICAVSGGPTTGYIRKCMGAGKFDLAAENLNEWLRAIPKQNRKQFIRTTNDRVHGILSNRYTVFDDNEVLEATSGILSPYHNYTVKNYSITPEYMKTRIISNDRININGEQLSFGYDISNSRVGMGKAKIQVLIFNWICSNGVIFGGGRGLLYAQSHLTSTSREEFVAQFVDMLDHAPDTIEYIKKNIEASKDIKLNGESIQRYLDKFKLEGMASDNVVGQVKQMIEGNVYDMTLWGLTGAITEVAQKFDVANRENMERFAGKLLRIASWYKK